MSDNGNAILKPIDQLPQIKIGWNEKAQTVEMDFDPQNFKSWEFVVAALRMALMKAEDTRRLVMAAQMQMQAQQAMEDRRLADRLIRPGHRG